MSGPPAPAAAAAKILVVDDEAAFREVVTRKLRRQGYRVLEAVDGEEAVQKAQGKDIDLVVLDLNMPKLGGLEALSALKAIDPKIEVIIVTAYGKIENAVESMKLGAYDFVTKPVQSDDLLRIIIRALEKRRLSLRVDELQETNRFKSKFLASMSHELRTPMNAILGYTSLLLDRAYGEMTPEQETPLKRVAVAGNNLLQVINSILDLSKMAAGRMAVNLERFSLMELSREILEMMEGLAQAKHLTLEWNMTEDIPLLSDKTKVKQILVNLISNGIKFTSTGGIFVDSAQAPEASQVHIRVRDTGIGVDAENLHRLFREFEQIDSSAVGDHVGTGLGLAISKQFAELMGGTIRVESVAGAGTVFTVVLPLESQEAKESTISPDKQYAHH